MFPAFCMSFLVIGYGLAAEAKYGEAAGIRKKSAELAGDPCPHLRADQLEKLRGAEAGLLKLMDEGVPVSLLLRVHPAAGHDLNFA